jgi:hypothetical protein
MRLVQMRPQSYVILPTDGAMPISSFTVGVHCRSLWLQQACGGLLDELVWVSLGLARLVEGILFPVWDP